MLVVQWSHSRHWVMVHGKRPVLTRGVCLQEAQQLLLPQMSWRLQQLELGWLFLGTAVSDLGLT